MSTGPRRITKDYFCSIEVAVDCISGKWKPTIVYYLKGGPLRFTELLRLIPRASRKVLVAQLRELEADGLVDRRPLDDAVPKGVEYSLTAASRTLLPILQALHEWGVDHGRRHGIDLRLPEQDREHMMVIEYVRYKIPADQADQFVAAYAAAGDALRRSSHCLGFELSRCVEEPTSFILRIEWDSVDGHMNGFRKSPEFREFFASVRPFVGNLEEMRHYEAALK